MSYVSTILCLYGIGEPL